MSEIKVQIPEDMEREIEASGLDAPAIAREAITLKLFEKQLAASKTLQRALFETIAAKSKLTAKGAQELAALVNKGMLTKLHLSE